MMTVTINKKISLSCLFSLRKFVKFVQQTVICLMFGNNVVSNFNYDETGLTQLILKKWLVKIHNDNDYLSVV